MSTASFSVTGPHVGDLKTYFYLFILLCSFGLMNLRLPEVSYLYLQFHEKCFITNNMV